MPFLRKLAAGLLQPLVLLWAAATLALCDPGTASIASNAEFHGPVSDLLKSIVGAAGLIVAGGSRASDEACSAGVVPFVQSVRGGPCPHGLPLPMW